MNASENATDETYDLFLTDEQVIMSNKRARLVLEAVWEIEQLCVALRRISEEEIRVVRGVSKRIQDLSGAVMSALDDASHSTSDLFSMVCIDGQGVENQATA